MRKVLSLTLLSLLALCAHTETVDADQERDALARIDHELAVIEQLTYEAERKRPSWRRVSFRYDALRRDLHDMRAGIQDHIQAPRQDPRRVQPLDGDYR